jgi:hypothetical protein
MTSDRRAFLAALASTGAFAACSGAHPILPGLPGAEEEFTVDGAAANTMPLKIVNNTGYADSAIWFYVVGQPKPGLNLPWVHMIDAQGHTKNCVPSDGKDGVADYSLRLSTIANATIALPSLHGGRFYFSVRDKLQIPIGKDANPVPGSPPGWVGLNNNYTILFDNWEYTMDANNPETGFNFNATQVDMLGIPMSIRGIGTTETNKPVDRTIGFPAGARSKIFAAMKANPAFRNLVIRGGGLGDLRVIAPNLGIDPASGKDGKTPLFAANYFDAYITQLWTHYKTNTLTAKTSQGSYVGQVDGQGFFAFTKSGSPTIYFKKPTTREVFECNMQPMCGDTTTACPLSNLAAIEIKGALPAAMNRSTLPAANLGITPGEPPCNQSLRNAYKTSPTNAYSKIMHDNALNGAAYGFGNDDVCAGSSYVAIRKPTRAVVTLQAF